jgi:Mrp family chromosome partitioning ATPase
MTARQDRDTDMDNPRAAVPFTLADFATIHLEQSEIENRQLVAFSNRDARARGFNLLRTSLSKRLTKENARLFGMTSATPNAGKTFLSINLAASLSRVSETPVYIVDLDLRMASVLDALNLEIERGIEQFLIDPAGLDLRDFCLRVADTNLVIVPSKREKNLSAELMASSNYDQFIETLRMRTVGSPVIFDLPPVFANDDAMLSVEQLDGYVLIADSGKTTKGQVRELKRIMDPAPCLGTILNRYRGGFGDSYGYGYGGDLYDSYYR